MECLGIKDRYNAAHTFIERNIANGLGNKTAIYYKDETYTYQRITDLMNQFGNALQSLDIELENRILLVLDDTPNFAISFFGAIKIGVIPIPVNPRLQPYEYEYFLNNSRSKALIVEKHVWETLSHLRKRFLFLKHVIVVDNAGEYPDCHDFQKLISKESTELEFARTESDDAGFWLYTSGSTGLPKGVVHLQRDMEVALNCYAKGILNISETDITFSASKLYFAYGLGGGLYFSFGIGGSTVLMREIPSPEKIFEHIETYRPTVFFGVPTLYAAMLRFAENSERTFDLSSLRVCVSAGEALPELFYKKFKNMFHVDILDGIGSTEATHIYISNRFGNIRPGSTGLAVDGYEIKIVDEAGNPVPPNVPGDLLLKGDSLARGYWNIHETSKKKFVGEWYNTGDKYYQDTDGFYWYCGRSDDMLKSGGIWVSPIEVENALLHHEAILEAAVIGEEDGDGLTKPVAYLVLNETASKPDESELRAFLKQQLDAYKCPKRFVFVSSLPKTASGKIQRFKLRNFVQA
ncbi:benzoate-CoA ligase family protein [Fodinisporobacter ferrooxydans]|uniref:Benzoate-CoA ligase family protein n=1 Tax=Fodinisporobacter ferrooxydans TaxID=2901836 RepID=A0ABY4CP26_9BACL|nr:benzoate-CoA ligase family protein [Alicyclobacillaceae bacterium MYW30-H2]